MPVLLIITGSNGAGKSSIGPDYVPSKLRDAIFDGDKLFMEISKNWINIICFSIVYGYLTLPELSILN